jgi:5-methylcytosine-specific restriction endonuclease McrA
MSDRLPWFPFHTADWRGDLGVQTCSLAARGLWMDMLSIMHEAKPPGHLVLNGRAMTVDELARLISSRPKEVEKGLAELERNRVFSRTAEGVIFSRRMVRDRVKRETASRNGKLGGNPAMLGASVPPEGRQIRLKRSSNPTKVAAVWEACEGRCGYCGCEMTRDNPYAPTAFQIDHVIPIAEGGTNDMANLRGACRRCNFAKGIKSSPQHDPVNHATDGDSDGSDNRAISIHAGARDRDSETRVSDPQVQEHRAEDVAECVKPVEIDSKLLAALVRAEWKAYEKSGRQFEDETDLSEHMKSVAARAGIAYDGPSIATAIRGVGGSNGRRLS